MSASPIVAEHLTKTFPTGGGVTDVDLQVAEGQVFGFLGPNGAGKSTTIRCLLGLYRPAGGRVRVLGRDPAGGDVGLLREVGYLPGELRLPPALTGADVVARFARLRGLTDHRYRDELVERLGARLDGPVRSLSTGTRQKLGIVLAFMHRPRLLVLDEPTTGLDPILQEEFATLVEETVREGRTILLSSHDLGEVQRVAHHVAIIRSGRIVVDDTIAALRAAAPHTIELTFDHDVDPASLARLPGVTVTDAGARRLTLTHTGSAAPVLDVVARLAPVTILAQPTGLEELFRTVYADGGRGCRS